LFTSRWVRRGRSAASGGEDGILRASDLGGRDELHGGRDLLGVIHGLDPIADGVGLAVRDDRRAARPVGDGGIGEDIVEDGGAADRGEGAGAGGEGTGGGKSRGGDAEELHD